MRFILFLISGLWCAGGIAHAQMPATPDGPKQPRILILLDGSSSMLQPWGAGGDFNRFKAASQLIGQLMDSMYAVNPAVEFGLRVYGQNFPAQENNCFDTEREVMFSKDNRGQMAARLADIHPRGVSPIAYALQQAAKYDLENETRNAYSIILVTDGGESCNGKICEVAEQLLKAKIFFKPYIVSMVDYEPLRQEYACLGSFLKVNDPLAMAPAVHTIIDEYRPLLTIPKVVVQRLPDSMQVPTWLLQQAPINYVPVSKDPAPKPAPKPEPTIAPAPKPEPKPEPKPAPVPARPDTVATTPQPAPRSADVVVNMAPARPAPKPELMRFLNGVLPRKKPSAQSTPAIAGIRPMSMKRVPLPFIPIPVELVATTPQPATPQPATPQPPAPQPAATVPKRDSTTVTISRIAPPTTAPKTVKPVKPAATAANPPAEPVAQPSVERSPAPEALTAVYFTDGKGRFYKTTPRVQFINKTTGAVVADFIREVNDAGDPTPGKIPPGQYRLVIKGKAQDVVRDVEVVDKMMNRIMVKVTHGSLRFAYAKAPNRPITEYEAIVNRRFAPGPVIRQKCTAELTYEPGNYYIEINTIPVQTRNVDIDLFAISEIQIPEPGQLQLTNADAIGPVQIYRPYGDAWTTCATINVTGDQKTQGLEMMPGTYEARWKRGPVQKVQRFEIKSNFLTQAELE